MSTTNRIFIIGHPGAGKTYLGNQLAEKLGYQLIDTDLGIEAKVGLILREIIGDDGVIAYKKNQHDILKGLLKKDKVVIVTDGPINASDIKSILQSETVIYLKTSTKIQIRRSVRNQPALLKSAGYEFLLNKLHAERDDFYEEIATVILEGDEGDINTHIEFIIKKLSIQKKVDIGDSNQLTDKDRIFFKYGTDIPVTLSEQQAICLKLLAQGLTAKQIAKALTISFRTVESYVEQLKEKLNCRSTKELIRMYHDEP